MKTVKSLLIAVALSGLTFTAIAHEHGMKKESKGEKYDCEAVNNMDHSKMDMNDPKMQDMMKQCGAHGHGMHGDSHGGQHHNQNKQHGDGHGNHGNSGHNK